MHSLSPLRVCIAGAGAVGVTLGTRIALAGFPVSVLARDRTLAAIRERGLRLIDLEGEHQAAVTAGTAADLGLQDVILFCAKAHDLPALVAAAQPLIGPQTLVVPVVNGVPFWYFEGEAGPHAGRTVRAVDPKDRLKTMVPPGRIIGAIATFGAERLAPNVACTANPLRLAIGEIDHRRSERVERLGAALESAGLIVQVSDALRTPLWSKIANNLASNPLSVVTGATLGAIYGDPLLAPTTRQLLEEARSVAAAHGVELDVDALLAIGAGMGEAKTSMLQDYEKGRPLELGAIADAVIELAALKGIDLPATRTIASLARFKGRERELARRSQGIPATFSEEVFHLDPHPGNRVE